VRDFVMGRAFADAHPVHSEDVLAEPDYDARTRDVLQPVVGYRSFLGVPIIRDGGPIGVIGCGRREVKPFTATQIELLKTFADQAAIAIENVRLLNELETRNRDLAEALEQQTATAEVLQVINSSPGDLAPVFDAMLEKATRLCEAAFGILWRFDGEFTSPAALYQVPTAFAEFWREPIRPGPDTGPGRVMRGGGVLAIADLTKYPPYQAGEPLVRAIVDLGGARSLAITPLRKDDATLGAITVYRQEVRPFTDKQITLLKSFAAQAVIAMENAPHDRDA
jgi:two-component system, NtrC family, sensor kinase